jgi:translocator protein
MGKGLAVNDYANYATLASTEKRRKHKVPAWLSLACFFAICFAVAGISAHAVTYSLHSWYPHLIKPRFTPPNWLYAPVWTILYATMAIAAWVVWRRGRRSVRVDGMVVFAFQLILSYLWIFFFFHQHRLLVSTVIILTLWMAIVAMIALFWRVRTIAGVILLPYLAWVTFAIALNLVILRHN